jgi:hypothetical protein
MSGIRFRELLDEAEVVAVLKETPAVHSVIPQLS